MLLNFFSSAKIGMMEDLEDMIREEEELKRKAERKKMREKELKKKRHWSLLQNIYNCNSKSMRLLDNELICLHMSHFSYACKMRCPLNLVLESWEYLWFYLTFWIAILDCGLKLHKLSIHTLVMLQKWLEIY